MTKNKSQTDEVTLTQASDFKLIHGIGPGIEKRLHDAGIQSYSQLGSMTPEDVVTVLGNLVGLTTKRITDQDWIGQARQLASETEPETTEIETSLPESRRHYAVFTVELLLDEDNHVRRTQLTHIQTQREISYAGWEPDRLTGFFIDSGELNTSHSIDITVPQKEFIEQPEQLPTPLEQPERAVPEIMGDIRLQDLNVKVSESGVSKKILTTGEPFNVYFILDLSKLDIPRDLPVNYSTTIYAKKIGGSRQIIGKKAGRLIPAERADMSVEGIYLQSGAYRIEAFVELTPSKQNSRILSKWMAMTEGNLLSVY